MVKLVFYASFRSSSQTGGGGRAQKANCRKAEEKEIRRNHSNRSYRRKRAFIPLQNTFANTFLLLILW